MSKNFVVNGDLARVAKAHRLNGRDLYVLFALLAEAQRRNTRTLQFPSTYAILKLLGWSDRSGDYDALDSAVDKWTEVEISIERFFVSPKAKTEAPEDLDTLLGQHGWLPGRRRRYSIHFPKVLDLFADGDEIGVSFASDFWVVNSKSLGYFAKANPDVIKQLRYPADILLYLLLDSYDGVPQIGMEALCAKIGLSARSRPWVRQWLRMAVGRINSATNRSYQVEVTDGDVVHIWMADFSAKAEKVLDG